jgi:integrase
MKMREQHLVPLSRQAVDVLREPEPLTNGGTATTARAARYVFPSARSRDRPMSNNAVLAALRRRAEREARRFTVADRYSIRSFTPTATPTGNEQP